MLIRLPWYNYSFTSESYRSTRLGVAYDLGSCCVDCKAVLVYTGLSLRSILETSSGVLLMKTPQNRGWISHSPSVLILRDASHSGARLILGMLRRGRKRSGHLSILLFNDYFVEELPEYCAESWVLFDWDICVVFKWTRNPTHTLI